MKILIEVDVDYDLYGPPDEAPDMEELTALTEEVLLEAVTQDDMCDWMTEQTGYCIRSVTAQIVKESP